MVKSQVNSPKKSHKPPFTKCGKTFSYNIFFFLIRNTHCYFFREKKIVVVDFEI